MVNLENVPPNGTENNSAQTGNASNPSPPAEEVAAEQLLPKEAEKYLREAGNIEDMPDAQVEADAEGDAAKSSDG